MTKGTPSAAIGEVTTALTAHWNEACARYMLAKILTSNWIALPVLLVAAGSLVLLYVKGRVSEAMIGGALLAVAVILIILGREKKDPDSHLP